jgi:RHS repeat-associated protein
MLPQCLATTPTQRRYTGQINYIGTGLYFYNARYYDPALARFTQADIIVLFRPKT